MIALLQRLSTRQNSILLLTLASLVCLPIGLQKLAPDAALSLLLPVTVLSALLAYGLATANIKKNWGLFILFACGPLILFIRIAQLGSALLAIASELLLIAAQIIRSAQGNPSSSLDLSTLFGAGNLLSTQAMGFGYRLFVWAAGLVQNKVIEDLAVRAFAWSLGLWLIAAWGCWQIRRHGKALLGLTPATIALGLILFNTAPKSGILWLYLSSFLLLLGITNYENLHAAWTKQGTDFSELVWEDVLLATVALALGLIVAGYLVSSFSIKEMLDRMRERQTVTASPLTGTAVPGVKHPQVQSSLPEVHAILGGPTLSQDVVMFISTGEYQPMPHAVNVDAPYYHWRALTYQTYTGSGWYNPRGQEIKIRPHQMLIQTTPMNYRIVHQTVTFPEGVKEGLYWTGTLVQSDSSLQVSWRSQPAKDARAAGLDPLAGADMVGGLVSQPNPGSAQQYTAESILPNVSEADLRAAQASYPAWVSQRYLALPDTVPERVRALARDLTANAATPFDQALAIEAYLRKIPYSLKVPGPPANRDAADYFLFDLKTGYCDYYATAMTVLARAVGLPARLVIGYASGTYDPYNAQYVVRQADAHAWTEIYFSGIGWIEFEPTANQPALFRPQDSQPLPQTVFKTPKPVIWDQLPKFLTGQLGFTWKPPAALLLLYFLWIGTDGLRLGLYVPSEAIQRLFGRLRRLAHPISGDPSPDETACEYAAALTTRLDSILQGNRLKKWLLSPAPAQISSLTDLYTQSLFSPTPLTCANIRGAGQTWGRLRWRLLVVNILLAVIDRAPSR